MPLHTAFPFPPVHAAPLRSSLHATSPSPAWLQTERTTQLGASGGLIQILWFFFKAVWPEVAVFKNFTSNFNHYFFSPKDSPPVQLSNLEGREKRKWRGIKGRERPYLFFSQPSGYHLDSILAPGFWMQSGSEMLSSYKHNNCTAGSPP